MATTINGNYARFWCKICDYTTPKKSSFDNHCKSIRHNISTNTTTIAANSQELCSKKFQCDTCIKTFSDRSGLWRHKKKCVEQKQENINNFISDSKIIDKDALVIYLLKQNSELQKSLIEMSKVVK